MKKTHDKDFLTQAPINTVIFSISIPLMFNNLIRTLYNLTDGLFVAQISSEDFAATSFVWPINFLFISIGMGLGVGTTALISQLLGAHRREEANRYGNNALILTFSMGLILSFIGYLSTPTFLRWMGATGGLLDKGIIYLQISFIGLFFDFVYFAYQAFLNAQGKTRDITLISVISSLTNVILDPIFIFPVIPLINLPGLNMGIAGAAWATVISKIVLAILAVRTTSEDSALQVSIKDAKFDLGISKHLMKISLPSAIGFGGSSLGFTVLNSLITEYGTNTLAAYSMVNRITDLLMQPQMGIGQAMTSIIGQNLGAHKFERSRAIFKRATWIIIGLSFISSLIVVVFRYPVLGVFIKAGSDPELWTQAIEYLYYTAFIIFFMGLFSVLNGFFQGSGKTQYAMWMTMGRLWVIRLPAIWLFNYFTDFGSTGIWLAMLISNALIVLVGFYIYLSRDWEALTLN